MAAEAAAGEQVTDWGQFSIGATVQAVVHELKDYGVIVDLADDPNLVGLIPLHQVRGWHGERAPIFASSRNTALGAFAVIPSQNVSKGHLLIRSMAGRGLT